MAGTGDFPTPDFAGRFFRLTCSQSKPSLTLKSRFYHRCGCVFYVGDLALSLRDGVVSCPAPIDMPQAAIEFSSKHGVKFSPAQKDEARISPEISGALRQGEELSLKERSARLDAALRAAKDRKR